MKLVTITKPFNKGTVWINPAYVLCVRETYIGHKNQGVVGTAIVVSGLNTLETKEPIESVVQKLLEAE